MSENEKKHYELLISHQRVLISELRRELRVQSAMLAMYTDELIQTRLATVGMGV
jgi:hypothetical protein